MMSYTSGLLAKLLERKTASLCTYYETGILNSQGQTEQPCSDVPLQDVDQSLENAEVET